MTLVPGTTVGRYQILEPLGQGGMATVYKAFQPSLEREVALKVLRPGFAQDAEFRERFEREAKSIARLRHPNIVQVFDFEVSPSGEFVLAMEFLDGGTLKDRTVELAAQGRGLAPKETMRILWEVADALSYAHEAGIVHRDVKPSNVMLAKPRDRAVVTDFGIARILGATSHTQTGVGIGTPEYMAPEQGQGGSVDHRADIYSLGAMAYELFVGRVPYTADTPLAVVIAHIKDPLPLPSKVNPTVGQGVERALLRALAKDPAARYDTALAFAEALREGLAADSVGGTMPTLVARRVGAAAAPSVVAVPASRAAFTLPFGRPPATIAAAAAVLLVAGTLVVTQLRPAAPSATDGPTATIVVTSRPTAGAGLGVSTRPPLTSIPKGALVYEARLDGKDPNFRIDGTSMFSTAEFESGKLNIGSRNNVPVGITLASIIDTFVGEVDFTLSFALDITLRWVVREAGSEQLAFVFDGKGNAGFQHMSSAGNDTVGSAGKVVSTRNVAKRIAVVVEADRYTAFVDGDRVAEAIDTRFKSPSASRIYVTSGNGGTVGISGARLYSLAPTATVTASPSPSPHVPPKKIPAKGKLIRETTFAVADLIERGCPGRSGDTEVTFRPTEIEMTLLRPNDERCWELFNLLPPDSYIVEMDLAFAAGSDARLRVYTRQSSGSTAGFDILSDPGQIRFASANSASPGAAVSEPSIFAGRALTIAIVSEPAKYTLFVDEKARGVFTETRPLGLSRPQIRFSGNKGSLRITGIRIYEVPQ